MTTDNRVARNQAPPLVGHNTVTSDAALVGLFRKLEFLEVDRKILFEATLS